MPETLKDLAVSAGDKSLMTAAIRQDMLWAYGAIMPNGRFILSAISVGPLPVSNHLAEFHYIPAFKAWYHVNKTEG